MNEMLTANAADLELELAWFNRWLNERLRTYLNEKDVREATEEELTPPSLDKSSSSYAAFVIEHELSLYERLALVLSLVPHVRPRALDRLFTRNAMFDRPFTEFGGEVAGGAFQPTGETLAFILAGIVVEDRIARTQFLFDPTHPFTRKGVLSLIASRDSADSGPALHQRLCLSPTYVALFTTGGPFRPEFSTEFPARLITTDMTWDDLVINDSTRAQLEDIERWISHHHKLRSAPWPVGRMLRPGYRSLFYGPPGTGKTLAVTLLGAQTKPQREVYRIDLSQMVSKWIGETEKNLARLFDLAQDRDWILFFDEADALFGKRTETRDSHDRYANQEVSYLLQRIESYNGIAILATNLKANVDNAFLRRFESVVHFPMPGPAERLQLWERCKPGPNVCDWDEAISLQSLATRHSLTGASIVNIMRDACLLALNDQGTRDKPVILNKHVQAALQKEYHKEDRSMGA